MPLLRRMLARGTEQVRSGNSRRAMPPLRGSGSAAGVSVTPEKALQIGAVYSCVRLLAETGSMLPVGVYRQADGGRAHVDDHPIAPLIIDSPNPNMDSAEFFRLLLAWQLLRGNAYAYVQRNRGGDPVGLWPIAPTSVEPRLAESGRMFYAVTLAEDEFAPITERNGLVPSDNMLHYRALGFGLEGLSPVGLARQSVGTAWAAQNYIGGFFDRDASPGGVVSVPDELSDQSYERLEQQWKDLHEGFDRSHRLAILEAGAKWEKVSLSPADAAFIDTHKLTRSDIAGIYGVPPHMIGDVEKSTCLPAETQVFTVDGPRRIDEVRVGDRVWSLDWSSKTFRSARVWRSERTGCDPIVKIRTRSRVLRANAQHRVLVRRKFPAPRPGYGGYRAVEWRNEWIAAGEITTHDYLIAANGLPDGTSREAPNGRVVTEGFAAFLGLLIGDGTVNRAYVSIARHGHAPYMDAYREIMRREFYKLRTGGRGVPREQRARLPITLREYERYTAFSSVTAATELRELGVHGTARTKRVPEWVFGLTPDLIAAFLAGYIDSDGAVNSRGWITFSSVNPDLLEDVRHLCMAIGVPIGTVRRYQASGSVELLGRTVTRGDMYQLFAYDTTANRKITPYHPEKASRIREAAPSSRVSVWSPDYQGRGPKGSRPGETFRIDGAALQKVVEITEEPPEDVYDLGVEGTHSFIANGLVVHNSWGSGIEQQSLGYVLYALTPWLTRLERVTARLRRSGETGLYVRFNVDGLLRGDIQSRYSAYAQGRQWGWLSANDVRRAEDEDPIADGDRYLEPVNMTSPDQLGQAPERLRSLPTPAPAAVRAVMAPADAAVSEVTRHREALDGWFAELRDHVLAVHSSPQARDASEVRGELDDPGWVERLAALLLELALPLVSSVGSEVAHSLGGSFRRELARAYVETNADYAADNILRTTREQVERALADGDERSVLVELFAQMLETRPAELARARVNEVGNFARHEAARQAGVTRKTWRSTGSETRPSHAAADGQTVGIDEQFVVGGRRGRWPRDHRLGVDEVAGCDCVLEFEGR